MSNHWKVWKRDTLNRRIKNLDKGFYTTESEGQFHIRYKTESIDIIVLSTEIAERYSLSLDVLLSSKNMLLDMIKNGYEHPTISI